MAKPKPTEYSIATSVTLPIEMVVKINKLTDNRSAWIRGLINKEIERHEKLNKLSKR